MVCVRPHGGLPRVFEQTSETALEYRWAMRYRALHNSPFSPISSNQNKPGHCEYVRCVLRTLGHSHGPGGLEIASPKSRRDLAVITKSEPPGSCGVPRRAECAGLGARPRGFGWSGQLVQTSGPRGLGRTRPSGRPRRGTVRRARRSVAGSARTHCFLHKICGRAP